MFDGEKITQRIQAHRESPRPKLDSQGDGLEDIQSVFESMVAIDPADRFQSAAEAAVAVESCLRQLRVELEEVEHGESTTVNTDGTDNEPSAEEGVVEPEIRLLATAPTSTTALRPSRLIAMAALLAALGLVWLLIILNR